MSSVWPPVAALSSTCVLTASHQGEFANEVVDVASKLASRAVPIGEVPFPDADSW